MGVDLVAVAEPVAVGVRSRGVCAGVEFGLVGQAITVRVGEQRI